MGSLDYTMSKAVSTDLQGLCTMKNFKTSPHSPGVSIALTTQNHTDMEVQPKVNKSPGPVWHNADGFSDSPPSYRSNTSPQPCFVLLYRHNQHFPQKGTQDQYPNIPSICDINPREKLDSGEQWINESHLRNYYSRSMKKQRNATENVFSPAVYKQQK